MGRRNRKLHANPPPLPASLPPPLNPFVQYLKYATERVTFIFTFTISDLGLIQCSAFTPTGTNREAPVFNGIAPTYLCNAAMPHRKGQTW